MTDSDTHEAIKVAVRRLRRTRSGDADLMQLCDLIDEAFGRADPPRPLHPLWKREPPEP